MEGLEILIPIIGVSIPLAAAVGVFIVRPIAKALSGPRQPGPDPRVAQLATRLQATEDRLERMERVLQRVEEAQDFHRQLSKPAGAVSRPGPGA